MEPVEDGFRRWESQYLPKGRFRMMLEPWRDVAAKRNLQTRCDVGQHAVHIEVKVRFHDLLLGAEVVKKGWPLNPRVPALPVPENP